MTRAEALTILADGEPHVLPRAVGGWLVATGEAAWIAPVTIEDALENKRRGCPPVRITPRAMRERNAE